MIFAGLIIAAVGCCFGVGVLPHNHLLFYESTVWTMALGWIVNFAGVEIMEFGIRRIVRDVLKKQNGIDFTK